MDAKYVEDRYLYVNKRCGLAAGTWPFGKRRTKWICRFMVFAITASGIFTQIAWVAQQNNIDAVIAESPFFLLGVGILIKESNYIIHESQLREIYECLFKDWLTERPKDEIDILEKFAKRGMFFNRLYVATGIFCYISFTTVAVTPRVLDLVSPINGTRGVGFIYPAYYLVDEEEYYYYLMGHMLCVINIVFVVFISCDTIYMNILQHACGLFGISGYRFKCAIGETDENIGKHHPLTLEETYRRVCHSVKAHQHAIEYITMITDLHDAYLFIAVGMTMFVFSITLVKMSTMDLCVEFYKYCGFLMVQLVHLLFIIIQGHFVILSQDETYNDILLNGTANFSFTHYGISFNYILKTCEAIVSLSLVYSCDAMWYNASPKTQALYVLTLRRSLTPPLLTAGGLISLNLETFAEILKASVSFFTVMKST